MGVPVDDAELLLCQGTTRVTAKGDWFNKASGDEQVYLSPAEGS